MNLNALEREEIVAIPQSVLDQPAVDGSMNPMEVGAFTGWVDAMSDIVPAAALSTTSSMYGAFGDFWERQIGAAAAEAEAQGLPVSDNVTKNLHANLEEEAREIRRRVREEYTPSPETTGFVGQTMYGIGVELTKAAGASIAGLGNPGAASLLYGAEHGIARAQNLKDAGVDEDTATDAGMWAFAAGVAGMRLPAAFGRSRLQSTIFGATVNPALNVSEDLTVKFALQSGNAYSEAAKIDAFDPVNIAISAVVGSAFGALGWRKSEAQIAKEKKAAEQKLAAEEGPRQQGTGTEQALAAARSRVDAPLVDESRSALRETDDVARVRESSQRRLVEEDVGISARQNRNRNTAASIAQMASIAGNPDYQRLSSSRVLADGAPAIGFVHDLPPEQLGRTEIVSASDGSHFEMRYAVMEARDIQYSNRVDGTRVEGFEDVKKNVAIAGNGRVAGLEAAYERGNAAKYKAAMMADDYHGISAGVIEKMDRPVLVRIMKDKDAARPDIAMLSNRSGTLALSATEQAQNDAAAIDVAALTFGEDGEITDETIRQFAALVPDNASLVDRNGVPNTMARPRLERAIFQRAYGNANLTSLLTDADGVGGRVVSVLLRTAPKMMQLEDAPELDFRKPLVDAVNEIYVARASGSGMSIREIAASQPIGRTPETQAFLDYFATIGNNVKGPSEVFNKLADWALFNRNDPNSMFANETPAATRVDLMQQFQELTGVQVDPHVLDMVGAQVTRAEASQKVLSTLRTNLSEAGFPEDQVEAQAQLWAGAVMRMADQSGRDPLDLLPKIKMGSGERPEGFEQIAFHGSPHVFDTFSTEAIGTGEGAQAHGWGLYFTKSREVAQGYRDRLLAEDADGEELMPYKQEYAETKREEFDKLLDELDPEDEADSSVIQTIEALRDENTNLLEMYDTVQDIDDMADIDNRAIRYVEDAFSYSLSRYQGGRVFEVDIPEDRVLLDEQKKISEQPAVVRDAVVKLVPSLARFLTNPADVTYQAIRSRGLSVARNAYQFESALRNAFEFAEAHFGVLSGSHDLIPGEWDVISRLARSMRRNGDFRSIIASMNPTATEEEISNSVRALASYGDAVEYTMARNILNRLARDVDKKRFALSGEPNGRGVYEQIWMQLGSDREASLALKNLGVEGITYMGGTDGRCFVVFDDKAVKVMDYWQKNGGDILGAYNARENVIRLTPNADITTFSHEMGHWWLSNFFEVTKSKETDLSLRKDARILLDHFGIKDQAEWDALGVEGQRRYHEQFASYVEEYLTTGRAPTPQMRSLLEKFRQWIVGIYRDFRAHLNERYRAQFGEDLPPLSDDVRGVLERNLLIDDALAASYKEIQPTHAATDAARYRLFETTVRGDQPVEAGNARDMQASLFAEGTAAEAIDSGEKVSIQAPVDVDRVRGERDTMIENLGGQEAFRAVPQVDEGLPVTRPDDTARPAEEASTAEVVEEETPQGALFKAVRRFFMGGEAESETAGPGARTDVQEAQARPSVADAQSDEARTQSQAEEILRRNPDLRIEADAEDGTAGRTAQELIDSVNRETAEADRVADILPGAAQCILRNGGI